MIDALSAASAFALGDTLGLDPMDLARGLVDLVAGWFGAGQCSSENKARKLAHVRALDDQTLMDLVNGRRAWGDFSKGDCGKWFQAYAIQELLKRFDAQGGGAPRSSTQPQEAAPSGSWRRVAGTIFSGNITGSPIDTILQAPTLDPYAAALRSPTIDLRGSLSNPSPGLQAAIELHELRRDGFNRNTVVLGQQALRAQEAAAAAAKGGNTMAKVVVAGVALTTVGIILARMRRRRRR